MSTEKFLGKYLIATQSARGWVNAGFSTNDEQEALAKLRDIQADPGRGRDRLQDVAIYLRVTPKAE
jgi:hypothetical protein